MACAERFSEPANVHIDRSFFDIDIPTPDPIEQLSACEGALRVCHEELQQAIFDRA